MISASPIELGSGARLKTAKQRPSEKIPYRFSVSGGAIASAPWTSTPAGLTLSAPVITSGPNGATSDVLISGAVAGTNYTVECTATLTTSGAIFTGVIVIQGIPQ